ncbi:hypothetical protein F383_09900 [Gossypium arboreum]|uniref:Uncharacterized protein n=1 Tax=Gossypium arboreum TaxID=29729 RepID=A0A0B0PGU4_GOSAR|nr:hypothetical protein F383_09900 [Gossypium arboreum]
MWKPCVARAIGGYGARLVARVLPKIFFWLGLKSLG